MPLQSPLFCGLRQYGICTKGDKMNMGKPHIYKVSTGLPLDVCYLDKCFGLHDTHTRINTPLYFRDQQPKRDSREQDIT